MTEWTPSADQALDALLERARARARANGADPDEVADDVRRHVEAELSARDVRLVTAERIEMVAAEIGLGADGKESTIPPTIRTVDHPPKRPLNPPSPVWIVLFGLVLPSAALFIEVASAALSEAIDPVPSLYYAGLIALVPLTSLLCLLKEESSSRPLRALLGLLNAMSFSICLVYCIAFIPMVLLGLILMPFGIGFLVMSPWLALLAAALTRIRLWAAGTLPSILGLPTAALGCAAGLALALGPEVNPLLTELVAQSAIRNGITEAPTQIAYLRRFGDRNALLALAHGAQPDSSLFSHYRSRAAGTEARSSEPMANLWFLVTGESLAGASFTATGDLQERLGRRRRAGGRRLPLLSQPAGDTPLTLAASRLDGRLEGDAAAAYFEWTLTFENSSREQKEARFELLLPAGGAVSRATLWVNGKEQEAAFGSRERTTAAYASVVSRRRDPLLVTSLGGDRAQVRCFPVPPAGQMKIRLGVSAPLRLAESDEAAVRVPRIADTNFEFPSSTQHEIWLESMEPITASSTLLSVSKPTDGRSLVRGSVAQGALDEQEIVIRLRRNGAPADACFEDSTTSIDGSLVRQRVESITFPALRRLVVVADGSRGLAKRKHAVADGLRRMEGGPDFLFILSGDTPVNLEPGPLSPIPEQFARAADLVESSACRGGADAVTALTHAWDLAAQSEASAVLWIHGPQPGVIRPVDALRQRLERQPSNPRMITFAVEEGRNVVLEQLPQRGISRIGRTEGTAADLARLHRILTGREPYVYLSRSRISPTEAAGLPRLASAHVGRLWAAEEIERLASNITEEARQTAIGLAMRYKLVSSVSGAVALESEAQFKQFQLQPADVSQLPQMPAAPMIGGAPEPEEWALLAVALAALAYFWLRRRT
ncbi:MAG: hypothetical protein JNJ88_14285 [Planctomycetes bacterium]|nr:hypothetical protein [Planctomycetota bacterium]